MQSYYIKWMSYLHYFHFEIFPLQPGIRDDANPECTSCFDCVKILLRVLKHWNHFQHKHYIKCIYISFCCLLSRSSIGLSSFYTEFPVYRQFLTHCIWKWIPKRFLIEHLPSNLKFSFTSKGMIWWFGGSGLCENSISLFLVNWLLVDTNF